MHFCTCLLFIVVFPLAGSLPRPRDYVTVMTFNIWQSGIHVENGLAKIAKHISHVNPDIVALQEVQNMSIFDELLTLLGTKWYGIVSDNLRYPDTAILARHPIFGDSVQTMSQGISARISLPVFNRTIHFFNIHLDWRSYGPYAANNKMVSHASQIMAGERNTSGLGRLESMRDFIHDAGFREALEKSDVEPLIVCGDFNAPSHLDWTEETKHTHGGWVFEWPTTKILQEEAMMTDSFRKLHPNPLLEPGNTWSTVVKTSGDGWSWTIPEPQDRIDFIFYKSHLLEPLFSYTYEGNDMVWPSPYHRYNDYPSDHSAVVTIFDIY